MSTRQLLLQILNVHSPTRGEAPMVKFLRNWAQQNLVSGVGFRESRDSLIIELPGNEAKPHLSFVGHTDTLPTFFIPREEDGRIHGSGASDMKAGIACFLSFLSKHQQELLERYRISCVFYAREEQTALVDNGLYDLLQQFPDYFESVDFALVGEPTNLTVQLGCLGSIHSRVRVQGKAAHSARPWDGENALYKAIPFIQSVAEFTPKARQVHGVEFFDVIEITESASEPGRTSIPGYWEASVNFRYAPVYTPEEAEKYFLSLIERWRVPDLSLEIVDNALAGQVVSSKMLDVVIEGTGAAVQAKQAWTDVAQLGAAGISCCNFGPGLTAQCHVPDEYVPAENLEQFELLLRKALLS